MPDHLHLLLAGEENSSLKDFMKIFKQRSGFYFKQRYNAPLWQPSYYDHVSRKEESLEEVARYIFENPVRKGLVDDWREYPLLGSMVFDLNEL
jgi:putative transposase